MTLDLLNPKSLGFDTVEDYYSAKFQVIPIRGFRFIMLAYTPHNLTHTHPHTHIHRDNVIAISAPLYYTVSANN